jgi:hypothetical protein
LKKTLILLFAYSLTLGILLNSCASSEPSPTDAFSPLGAALKPSDYGIEEFMLPIMLDAAVVGVGESPSGVSGSIVDVLWTRPIDAGTFERSSLMVGNDQASEVWVDERDYFVTHLLFDMPIDAVGGTVRLTGTVFDIWGIGIDSGGSVNAGFAGEKAHVLPFSGLKFGGSGPAPTPTVSAKSVATVYAQMTITSGGSISTIVPSIPTADIAATIATNILATQYPGGIDTGTSVMHSGVSTGEAIANVRNYLGSSIFRGAVLVDGNIVPGDRNCGTYIESNVSTWAAEPLEANSWRVIAVVTAGEVVWEKNILEWEFYPNTLAVNPSHDQKC